MNNTTIDKIVNLFEGNKEEFIKSINNGEFVGVIVYMFNRCINEIKLEERLEFTNSFTHSLISILLLSLFPIIDDKELESKMIELRKKMYFSIIDSVNKTSLEILKGLNIENFSTTVH